MSAIIQFILIIILTCKTNAIVFFDDFVPSLFQQQAISIFIRKNYLDSSPAFGQNGQAQMCRSI